MIQAETSYKDAIKSDENAFGLESAVTSNVRNNLAALYVTEGRFAQAEPLLQWVSSFYDRTYGLDHPESAVVLNNLGELYRSEKQYGLAEENFKRAKSIYEKYPVLAHSPFYATVLNNLALTYQDEHKLSEAETLYKESIAVMQSNNVDAMRLRNALTNYSVLLHEAKRDAEAKTLENKIHDSIALR
jgi:tetratricopeptide (TPR) repeat protein